MKTLSKLHVSQIARLKALDNIDRKMKVIETWIEAGEIPWSIDKKGKYLRDEQGELILDWHPTNIVEFAKWSTQNPSHALKQFVGKNKGFESFGRTTLDKAPAVKRSVLSAIVQLKKIASDQRLSGNKLSRINHLEVLLKWEVERKQEAQRQYVSVLMRAQNAETKIRENERLHRADIERLDNELVLLRSQNAELIAQVRKIKSIRSVE